MKILQGTTYLPIHTLPNFYWDGWTNIQKLIIKNAMEVLTYLFCLKAKTLCPNFGTCILSQGVVLLVVAVKMRNIFDYCTEFFYNINACAIYNENLFINNISETWGTLPPVFPRPHWWDTKFHEFLIYLELAHKIVQLLCNKNYHNMKWSNENFWH